MLAPKRGIEAMPHEIQTARIQPGYALDKREVAVVYCIPHVESGLARTVSPFGSFAT